MPDLSFIPEVPAYIGHYCSVPFRDPGSPELAASVSDALIEHPMATVLVLENHGQIALGKNPAEALRRAEFFELACRICVVGQDLRRYTNDTRKRLESYGRSPTGE
jgi:ribulose-5-phosphate 4-epimerase/fuculose-1-phosphate aldolase